MVILYSIRMAGDNALIFFGLFIYLLLTWFGTSIKMESQKEEKR